MRLALQIALAVTGISVSVLAVCGFVAWDWNPGNWSAYDRAYVVVFWALFAALAVLCIVENKT